MRFNQAVAYIGVCAISALCFTGCQYYGYRSLTVRVQDAATTKPVQGAYVRVEYQTYLQLLSRPQPAEGYSNAAGTIQLPFNPDAKGFVLVDSPGYKENSRDITREFRETPPSGHELPQMLICLEKN